MEYFSLEKPIITDEDKLTAINSTAYLENFAFRKEANGPEYKYWDKVRFQKPLPPNLTPEQVWFLVKSERRLASTLIYPKNKAGKYFTLFQTEYISKLCHELDMEIGGNLLTEVQDISSATKKMLVANGIMEEAIASSQLEGADTGRVYAKRMLREGLKPRTESEQMILNNHLVLTDIESSYSKSPMSVGMLEEMHARLTDKTLDDWGKTPHRRSAKDEPLCVRDEINEGTCYFQAPETSFVDASLDLFVLYANDELDGYLHPAIKSVVLHFWIGYLHAFTDGNGRLARAVAHWYMLRHKYWGYSYLPLSSLLKIGGKKAYTMAYVYSEQDDLDLTYFVSYIFRKMEEAVTNLKKNLQEKRTISSTLTRKLGEAYGFNERLALTAKYLVSSPENTLSFSSQMRAHGVSRSTAVKDFAVLSANGFIVATKSGRNVRYHASEKLRLLAKQAEDEEGEG